MANSLSSLIFEKVRSIKNLFFYRFIQEKIQLEKQLEDLETEKHFYQIQLIRTNEEEKYI